MEGETERKMGRRSISELKAEELVDSGLTAAEAEAFVRVLRDVVARASSAGPAAVWRELVERRLLRPNHPHALHQLVYYTVYSDWDSSLLGPPPYWFPSPYESRHTNLGRVMEAHGQRLLGKAYEDPITSFPLFQKFTAENPEIYWSIVLKELSVWFHEAPSCILDETDKSKPGGTWFPGSVLNIAECCLLPTSYPGKMDSNVAIVWREEGCDDNPVCHLTLKDIRDQVMLVANALDSTFSKGDVIAIDMPMTVSAVIIYLAIILSGRIVVSIADSFAAKEIATRLRVSQAKGVFTQDFILRGGRRFPLYRN